MFAMQNNNFGFDGKMRLQFSSLKHCIGVHLVSWTEELIDLPGTFDFSSSSISVL